MPNAWDRIRKRNKIKSPSLGLQKVALWCTIIGTGISIGIGFYAIHVAKEISNQTVKIDSMATLLRDESAALISLNSILKENRQSNIGLEHLLITSNDIFLGINKQLGVNNKELNISSEQLKLFIKHNDLETRSDYFRLKEIVKSMPFSKSQEIYLGSLSLPESTETLWYKRADTINIDLSIGMASPYLFIDTIALNKWKILQNNTNALLYIITRIKDQSISMASAQRQEYKRKEMKLFTTFYSSLVDLRGYFLNILDEKYSKFK